MLVDKYKQINPNDPYGELNKSLNEQAKIYSSQGIQPRASCQISLIMIRPDSNQKNIFIIDSKEQLIYLFNKDKKFVAKDVIISGVNEQTDDIEIIAKSLLDWNQRVKKLGFSWDGQNYNDTTGKNRKFDPQLVYQDIKSEKSAFLPKGMYTSSSKMNSFPQYTGVKNNLLSLVKDDKSTYMQAIHGFLPNQERTQVMNKAKEVLSKPEDPNVSKEFLSLVTGGKLNFKQSSSCINVTEDFLKYIREYGPNSYVFSIGETEDNYLVKNGTNYFDKVMNSESCPSPNSLGAEVVNYGVA